MARRAAPGRRWLLKSEPGVFSFQDLLRAPGKRTAWDGIRNHQARNFLRDEMRVGDPILFYHSSAEPPGVAGIARVAGAAVPDPSQFDRRSEHFDAKSRRESPSWVQVEIEAVRELPRFVPLDELRSQAELRGMLLLQRGQRLSVMPVTAGEWRCVVRLGGLDPKVD